MKKTLLYGLLACIGMAVGEIIAYKLGQTYSLIHLVDRIFYIFIDGMTVAVFIAYMREPL